MQSNKKSISAKTHEGASAIRLTPLQELEKTVLCCLLWEDNFYESGENIVDRISSLVKKCHWLEVQNLAQRAKHEYKLRHVPLLLLALTASSGCNSSLIVDIITRVDDMMELVSLYWKDGKKPLPAQMKKGLAACFNKFDEYQFAKYNRDKAIKLRDVMFLVHPKPDTKERATIFKKIADKTLSSPDTWEVALSGGSNKKETFERLLKEKKLGYLALLRNLRNMHEAKVSPSLIEKAIIDGNYSKILPYQFISAARAAPWAEPLLDNAMQKCMLEMPKISGKTIVLVDVSGSMTHSLSQKSTLNRLDASCAIAVLLRGICENISVFSFSEKVVEVPSRHGMALIDAIRLSQFNSSTYLGAAVQYINSNCNYDRLIVLTDEQSHDIVPAPAGKGYMLNVAGYEHSVGFGYWIRINGFSEAIVKFITEYEKQRQLIYY